MGHRVAIRAAGRKPDVVFPVLKAVDLPLAAIVGAAVVAWAGRVETRHLGDEGKEWVRGALAYRTMRLQTDAYGNGREGLWIWALGGVHKLPHPVSAVGQQRLWDVGPDPDAVIRRVAA